jgi:serine/threonine-protein kinase
VVLVSLESGETTVLVEGGTSPFWAPTGHLIYAQGSSLFAQPFDPAVLQLTGSPVSLVHDVRTEFLGVAQVSMSQEGSMVYLPGRSAALAMPVWVDRQGREESLGFPVANYGTFSLSPDGQRLAIVNFGAEAHVRLHDLQRGQQTRLTLEGNNHSPVWSPDGEWIVFSSDRAGRTDLWRKRANGSGEAERLTTTPPGSRVNLFSWSAACGCIFFGRFNAQGEQGWMLPADKGGDPELLWETSFVEWGHHLSPDGRWLAYVSDEPGQYDIFVQPFPPTGERRQVSFGGGEEPRWSRDGKELFYRDGKRGLSVAVGPGPEFEAGDPVVVFEGSYRPVWGYSYDVAPDGQRFLLYRQEPQLSRTHLNVILNWTEELKRLVPTN